MKSTRLSIQDGNQYQGQVMYESCNSRREGDAFLANSERSPAEGKGRFLWLRALWPLLVHGVLTVVIIIFMFVYVNGRNFNISERRPTVQLHDGTMIPWIFAAPLQSDITTILSIFIAFHRLVAAGWLSSLCWRCAFILMEQVGLKLEQLRYLISYNITSVPLRGTVKRNRATMWFIWVILTMTLPVQLAAPVLTGSITWVSGHYAPKPLSNSIITTSQVKEGTNISWSSPTEAFSLRRDIGWLAAGFVFLAWGRDATIDAPRRYLPKLRLEINSTLDNVTLPYFSVDAFEWIRDPNNTLSAEQLDIEHTICPRIAGADPNVGPVCRAVINGASFLIPDTPWPNQTYWQPKSSVVSEKRLMLKCVGRATGDSNNKCSFYNGTTLRLSSDNIELDDVVYISPYNQACYAFAWVTYTAGASTCYNCPVLSYGTVQSSAIFPVKPDILTGFSLRFMTDAAELMQDMGAIDMAPTWKNAEEDAIGTLIRSYSTSWMALIEALGGSTPPHNTTYSISAPASRASVNYPRVYIWLCLHFLVTLSGVLFLYVQSLSPTPIIVDTTLAAFYLDTSAVSKHDEEHGIHSVRRVEFEDDRLRLKTE